MIENKVFMVLNISWARLRMRLCVVIIASQKKLFVVLSTWNRRSKYKMAPEVGFEPTTNRLIPTASGLYH
jgi:hypothetical protein